MRAFTILLGLLAIVASCSASAEPAVYFLSVGSSRYLEPSASGDHGFQRLDGARNGATALSDRLSQGGARFGITLSSPEGTIVGLADFDRALDDILVRIRADKPAAPVVVVYIAAHGISDGFAWNHFSVPGDLTYRGDPDALPPDQLAEQAIYAAAVVDRLNKAHVHYVLILDTCYEGKASVFESPVLSATALQNIGDIDKALRFANEFHQGDPVLFSTTPGTTVPVAPDPTDPASNSMGPLARRLVMLIDARAEAHANITVGDIVTALQSPSVDRLTRPAVTNAVAAAWWNTALYRASATSGQVEEREGTATSPRLCCVADTTSTASNAVPVRGTITLTGAPGEFITDGKAITLRDAITLERPDPRSMTLRVPDPDGDWELDFTAAKPFAVTSYAGAERAGFAKGRPGLAITGHGRACNEVRGRFAIINLPSPQARMLALEFTQLCDEETAPLTGRVEVRLP